jgi:4,5-DOPA dioxygenase extradiol
MNINEFKDIANLNNVTDRMPVLFIGHGNPMHALWDDAFAKSLQKMGSTIEKPNAVLVVSAHWLTQGTYVATTAKPETIHDFGGFPKELFQVQYAAPGAPAMAQEVLAHVPGAKADENWGLDHGAWAVLRHMFPKADIPVFQMSIDYSKPESYHLELAAYLDFLRSKGVLILASGNIVHNLRLVNWQNPQAGPFDWAQEFDAKVKTELAKGNYKELANYRSWGKFAELSVPTNDHYLPMMYTLGLAKPKDELSFLFEGFEMGSISQRCFMIS